MKKYVLITTYLLLVTFAIHFLFVYERNISDKEIKDKLISSGNITKLYLNEHLFDKTLKKDTISKEEDLKNIIYLSKIAKALNVEYIYSFKKINEKLYFTSSSATESELKTNTNISHYYSEYTAATDSDREMFNHENIVFEDSSDEWGSFKSILIPVKDKDGEINIVGVDIKIDNIKNNLIKSMITNTLLIIIMTLIILLPPYLLKIKLMKKISHFDILTGLPNRLEFQEKSTYSLSLSKRNRDDFSVLFLDLDGFKYINDSFGHECGDNLLIEVAKRIRKNIRETDIPCRQGGDEFLISLPSTTTEGAISLAEKVLEAVNKSFDICGQNINLSFSIGIATLTKGHNYSIKDLCKNADTAMYKAKSLGKNRIEVYS